MDYTIEEILAIARACGVEYELNSSDPGVFIVKSDGSSEKIDVFDLFEDMFVSKEE